MKTLRFETKVVKTKNLTINEVRNQVESFYAGLPAVYNKGGDNQITLSRSGSDVIIEFTRPIVLVPGISSFDKLTVSVKEIGNKQTYVTCSDFPGIRDIHFWLQYLPGNDGSANFRAVCDFDIAWYNPMGRVIQGVLERYRDIIDKEISKVSEQIEEELNKRFAPEKEEAENA